MGKRKETAPVEAAPTSPPKKNKTEDTPAPPKRSFEKKSKLSKVAKGDPQKFTKRPNKNVGAQQSQKPEDWNEFKKKKKELRLKRRQNKTGIEVITRAKQIGERLRCKTLKGGEVERNKLINELHSMLKGQGHYAKFVLAHDTSRIVQWLLKYSSEIVKNQISQELVPIAVDMLQSKYGIFAVKRLLKYGSSSTRSAIIDKMYGHAVKLTTHATSAPVFEYAYSTWASPLQKQHLVQEFFGEIYRASKDDSVKHMRDIFRQSPDLKSAILTATKTNLTKVLNKNLLDSGLVQTVLSQYLTECSKEDRAELISQLVAHIVVISNSKDGARAAMQCIWHGTNKDRKQAMKMLKDHVIELAKHDHGHCTIITLLDTADDTVLLHKIILSEILKASKDLAINEWGRKVLLWLVAPADPTCFHPVFVKELEEGRKVSTSKKDPEVRRKEILGHSVDTLVGLVAEEPDFWVKNSSLAYEMLAILKAGSGDSLKKALEGIVKVIVDPEWSVKVNGEDVLGVEEAGLHMVLKKLAKHDQSIEDKECCFGACVVEALSDETLAVWLTLNRGCFLLVAVYENSTESVQERFRTKLKGHVKLLKKQESAGSKILLKKLNK